MKLLYQSPCCRIEYDSAHYLLTFTLLGFLPSADLRASYEEVLLVAQRYEIRRWLNDFRQMRAVRQADQDWLVQDFTPRLIGHIGKSLRRSAIALSSDAMNQLFADDVVARTGNVRSWETRFFGSLAEARSWLLQPLNAQGDEFLR